MTLRIEPDDLSRTVVQDLLRLHLAGMRDSSPPGHSFALDLSGLLKPTVAVWTAWRGPALCGIGALKALADGFGEIKSMRTHPDHLRQGVGAAILEHLIAEARMRSLRRLSLETGSGPLFEPALALYRRRGFVNGEAFGDYQLGDFNQCLHLKLD